MNTKFSSFSALKIDQDWGGSEYLSFYCLTNSPTGNVYRTKIVKLKKFYLRLK